MRPRRRWPSWVSPGDSRALQELEFSAYLICATTEVGSCDNFFAWKVRKGIFDLRQMAGILDRPKGWPTPVEEHPSTPGKAGVALSRLGALAPEIVSKIESDLVDFYEIIERRLG